MGKNKQTFKDLESNQTQYASLNKPVMNNK